MILEDLRDKLEEYECYEFRDILFDSSELETIKKIIKLEKYYKAEKTCKGLKRALKLGKKLGRPIGSKNKKRFEDKTEQILKWIEQGKKKKEIAFKLKCSVSTITKILTKSKNLMELERLENETIGIG